MVAVVDTRSPIPIHPCFMHTMRMPIVHKGGGALSFFRKDSETIAAKNETVQELLARLKVSFQLALSMLLSIV